MRKPLKLFALVVVFVLAAVLAGAQEKQGDSGTPAAGGTTVPGFDVEAALVVGWDYLVNDAFASFLSTNGLTAIDPLRLWRAGWRIGYGIKSFYVAVGSSRTSNYIFGAYGSPQRTKLVWDSTDLTLGLKLVSTDAVTWSAGIGVGVSKVLLQAYSNATASFTAVYAAGGTLDVVTSWNWTPEVETAVVLRVAQPAEDLSIWLGVGVIGGWLPFDSVWRLFDDPEVTGIPKPFDFFVRPALWLEIR